MTYKSASQILTRISKLHRGIPQAPKQSSEGSADNFPLIKFRRGSASCSRLPSQIQWLHTSQLQNFKLLREDTLKEQSVQSKVKPRVLISVFGVAQTYPTPRAKILRERTVIAALLHIIKITTSRRKKRH